MAGSQALGVASAFRPDLMLIDLAMPDIDGCDLVKQFRQLPAFTRTKILAITGHADEGHRTLAKKAGFDAIFAKPLALKDIEGVLDEAKVVTSRQPPKRRHESASPETDSRLPIDEARRIRNERESRTLTLAESQAAICEGILRFQEDFMGLRSEQIHSHFIKDLLVVRIHGTLTLAERQLGKAVSPAKRP